MSSDAIDTTRKASSQNWWRWTTRSPAESTGPRLMGIVNVTPDSFSDGGDHYDPGLAIAHGERLAAEGATILDVGGESTRPNAAPIDAEEEWRRIGPVVSALVKRGHRVSVDTRHAITMRRAIDAGCVAINDITALTCDPESLAAIAASNVAICLLHMQGTPQTMQAMPNYADVVAEVRDFLQARIEACEAAGISRDRIIADPGIGFGKRLDHNVALIRYVVALRSLGVPLLYGVSRKSVIAALSVDEAPKNRVFGSVAAAIALAERGVEWLRVHDVAATRQALDVWRHLHPSEGSP